MPTNKFQFVEIADDLAQIIDGGMSYVDVKAAIERWKTRHPHGTHDRYWSLTMTPGASIEATPMVADSKQDYSQMVQYATDGGNMSAMAVGDRTAIGLNVYQDAQGQINRMSSSYSAS